LAVRSAIVATAWLLVHDFINCITVMYVCYMLINDIHTYIHTYIRKSGSAHSHISRINVSL